MLAKMAAHRVSQLCVLCLSQAALAKMPLLDLLQAFPTKLELVDSVLADASLPPQERAFMEQTKMYTQPYAAYGARLNYQALFGLDKPVAWDSVKKCAIGFDEAVKVWLCCAVLCCDVLCCDVLCCLICTMSAKQCAAAILTLFGVLLQLSSCPCLSAAFTL